MTSTWNVNLVDSFLDILVRLTTGGARYLLAFVGAFMVSLLLTPPVREFARKTGMVDQPNARRINKVSIPIGGGMAIFFAFHFVLLVFARCSAGGNISASFDYFWLWSFFWASSLLLVIGFLDDKYGLKPLLKLFGQIVVASILFFSGVNVGGIFVAFPGWLDYGVTVFWIVGAINAFNLIDGMDGLASGLSLIASMGVAGALVFGGHTADTIPYLILAGACLGFLRYNFHPASVFLGDSGSMFLGLCVATLPLMSGSRKELVASLGVPLLAMGIPIFDTMLAIWRRSARALLPKDLLGASGQTRVMQPDKDHLHHRILRKTMNQRTAAVTLYLASAALVLVGLSGMLLRNYAPGFFMIAFIVATVVAVRHMISVELWDTGRLLSKKRATLRQAVVLPVYIVCDIIFLVFAWVTARFFTGMPLGREDFIYKIPVAIAIVFVSLVVGGTYRKVWSRAQMRDYVVLTFTLLVATILAAGFMLMFEKVTYGLVKFSLVMFMCSLFPLIGIRVLRECVSSIVHLIERYVIRDREDTERVVVYGGGLKFGLFIQYIISRVGNNKTLVVGLVDDDINLKGRVISGYKVMGDSDHIESIVQETGAHRVIIACDISDDMRQNMLSRFAGCDVKISIWRCSEKELK